MQSERKTLTEIRPDLGKWRIQYRVQIWAADVIKHLKDHALDAWEPATMVKCLIYSSMCYFPHFLFSPSGAGSQLQLYAHVHLPCKFLVNTIEQMCMLDTNGQSQNMNFRPKGRFQTNESIWPNIWFLEHPGRHHQAKKTVARTDFELRPRISDVKTWLWQTAVCHS